MIVDPTTSKIAWRYFRARREQGLVSIVTAFSIAGLAVGVAALIVAMAVFTGFRLELRERLFSLEGALKILPELHPRAEFEEGFLAEVESRPNIQNLVPYIDATGIAFQGEAAQGALFRGMPVEALRRSPFADFMQAGILELGNQDGVEQVVIGTALARALDVSIGDDFRAYRATQQDADTDTLPDSYSFQVSGIFDSGVEEVDTSLILVSPSLAREMARVDGAAFDGAQVFLRDDLLIARSEFGLQRLVGSHGFYVRSTLAYDPVRDGGLGFSAAQHLQLARDQEAAMVVILALIIIVAAFGVIAGQMMKVREKSREIAVLRSFGAGRWMIVRIFMLMGVWIGLLGAALGVIIGLALAFNLDAIRLFLEGLSGMDLFPTEQFRLAFLPSRPTWGAVVTAVVMALVLTLLAMAYPAYRAAQLSPAEALRYE